METYQEPMLDMENQLLKDTSGEYKKGLLDQLETYQFEIKQQIDKGLSPEEFAVMNALNNAVTSAMKVIEAAHSQLHQSN